MFFSFFNFYFSFFSFFFLVYFFFFASYTSAPLHICGITTADSSKVRSGSFYKNCMENASKHRQIDEEEDDLFVLWFYTVISLDSLKWKKLFIYFWVIENI